MTIQELVQTLPLEVAAGASRLDTQVTGGYASDLLSCVMAGARTGNAWVTLQAHMNVVAVAALLELSCVIVTEGVRPEPDVLARAEEQAVTVLLSQHSTFTVVAQLAQLGVKSPR